MIEDEPQKRPTRPKPQDFKRSDLDRPTHQFTEADEEAARKSLDAIKRMLR